MSLKRSYMSCPRSPSKVTHPGLPDRAGMRGRQVRCQGATFEEALTCMTLSMTLNSALLCDPKPQALPRARKLQPPHTAPAAQPFQNLPPGPWAARSTS